MEEARKLEARSRWGKVDYLLRQNQIPVFSSDFGAEVALSVMREEDSYEDFAKEITDLTGGRTRIQVSDPLKYGLVAGEVRLL